jgi:hypothetical protein
MYAITMYVCSRLQNKFGALHHKLLHVEQTYKSRRCGSIWIERNTITDEQFGTKYHKAKAHWHYWTSSVIAE